MKDVVSIHWNSFFSQITHQHPDTRIPLLFVSLPIAIYVSLVMASILNWHQPGSQNVSALQRWKRSEMCDVPRRSNRMQDKCQQKSLSTKIQSWYVKPYAEVRYPYWNASFMKIRVAVRTFSVLYGWIYKVVVIILTITSYGTLKLN